MIPQALLIKLGVFGACIALIFGAGCRVQKQMDKANYSRAVGIIDTCQENEVTLEQAIKDQNEATIELGRQHDEKVSSINARHNNAIARLNAANSAAIRGAEEEAAELRQRMVGLSVGEACDTAMRSIVQ